MEREKNDKPQQKENFRKQNEETSSYIKKILNGEIILKFHPVDYNDPKIIKELKKVKKAQKEIMKRTEVNRTKLGEFHITI